MSSWEAACLTQIILRDLRPLLYPTPTSDPTTALLHFNSAAYSPLTPFQALKEWDPRLPRVYSRCSRLDDAVELLAQMPKHQNIEQLLKCKIGTSITIPKCQKGRSSSQIMQQFRQETGSVFAEVKYDGER